MTLTAYHLADLRHEGLWSEWREALDMNTPTKEEGFFGTVSLDMYGSNTVL